MLCDAAFRMYPALPQTLEVALSSDDLGGASPNTSSERYTILQRVGSGSFGTVFKAFDTRTRQVVAVKMIDLEESEDDIGEIQREIAMLSQCRSPYIVDYYESFVKHHQLWIVMEFMGGGSCLDLLGQGAFCEAQIAVILRSILLGLDYLHSQGKLHRDVKAANVLLSTDGRVKLADFSVASQLSSQKSRRSTMVGTPLWMAPEVICRSGYNSSADIWSLGIMAIELAHGVPPFSGSDHHPLKVLHAIVHSPPPTLEGKFSREFKEFVALCLAKKSKKRPTARQLLSHRFITQANKPAILQELIERASLQGMEANWKDSLYESSINGYFDSTWDFTASAKQSASNPNSPKVPKIHRPTAKLVLESFPSLPGGSVSLKMSKINSISSGSLSEELELAAGDEEVETGKRLVEEVLFPVISKMQCEEWTGGSSDGFVLVKRGMQVLHESDPRIVYRMACSIAEKMGEQGFVTFV
ncbi:uncharacterized protein VTP21DRAFT_11665 [Calcarisporiella thermophila]|uniref:uncharacterized protein n=1 Tax=Calcarisporiella thermophila TaxID=911321 RepID=UPI003743495F